MGRMEAEVVVATNQAQDLGCPLQIVSLGLTAVTDVVGTEAVGKKVVKLIKKEDASIAKQADLDQLVMHLYFLNKNLGKNYNFFTELLHMTVRK